MEKVIFSLEKYKENMNYDVCPDWAYDIDGCVCGDSMEFFGFTVYSCMDEVNDKSYIVSNDWVEVVKVD